MGGGELLLELFARILAAEEQVALDTLELAVDVFHRSDAFDAMNRGHVALRGEARTFLAVELLDVVVPVVQGGSEMRGGSTGFASADRAIIDDDDSTAGARQQVRRSHAGDARSDYANVGTKVLGEGLELGHFGCAHPDGGRVT